MKQTNSAIKFLLAQYRAIFKHAQLASILAIVAAAGLSIGQANAAAGGETFDNDLFGAADANVTVDGQAPTQPTPTADTYKTLELTGGADRTEKDSITISITGGEGHTIKGVAADVGTNTPAKTDVKFGASSITIAQNGQTATKLTIGEKGSAGSPPGTPAVPAAATNVSLNTLTVSKGTLELVADAAEANKTTVSATTMTIGGGQSPQSGDAAVKLAANSSITAGTLSIENGAAVSVSGGASLTGATVTMNSGSITLGDNTAADVAGVLSSTGDLNILGGEVSSAVDGMGNISASTITVGNTATLKNQSALTLDGKLVLQSGGTLANDTAQKTVTLAKGGTFDEGAKLSNSGDLIVLGETTFNNADTDITVDAQSSKLIVSNGATATMSSSVLAKFLGGASVESVDKNSGTIVVSGDTEVDLAANNLIFKTPAQQADPTDGKMNAKLGGSGALTVQFTKAKYDVGDKIIADAAAANKGVTLSVEDIALGKTGEAGPFVVSGVSLEVKNSLTTADKKAFQIDGSGSLSLNGKGSTLDIASVTLGDTGKSAGNLNVIKGAWSTKSLTVTSGAATVSNGAKLTLTKELTTAGTAGKLIVTGAGSTVDAVGVEKLTLASGGVALSDAGTFVLKGDKVVDAATGNLKTGFVKGSVSGSTDTKLTLISSGTDTLSMTVANYKKFRDAAGFKGIVDIKLSDSPEASGSMGLGGDTGVIAGVTNGYENTQAQVSGDVADNYYVGNAKVTSDGALTLGQDGALTLSNANANNGKGQYVTDKNGGVGSVAFTTAGNTLSLEGAGGKIGSITNGADGQGSVSIGKDTDVEVVSGSIGSASSQTGAGVLGKVNVLDGGSLTVESGSVYSKNLSLGKNSSLDVGTGTVDIKEHAVINGDVKAGTLSLAGTPATGTTVGIHSIAGNANVDVSKLSIGTGNILTVGDDGEPNKPETSTSATVYAETLDLGTGGILFVDPSYEVKATVVAFEQITAGSQTPGVSTVGGSLIVGANAALGVGYTVPELQGVISPYLNGIGAFEEKGKFNNALAINTPIKLNSGAGIAVDASLTDEQVKDPNNKTAYQNKLVLGEKANLIISDEAFGPSKNGAAITFNADSQAGPVNATISAKESSVITLTGDISAADTNLKLFAVNGGGGSVSLGANQTLKVEAAGGLISTKLDANNLNKPLDLQFDKDVDALIRTRVSAPVADMFVAISKGEHKGESGSGYDFVVNNLGAKNYEVVDVAAHAATYAGAQQAAVAAVTTMAEAVGGRVGSLGSEAAAITATGSQANGGVWLAPMYKSVDADGFGAQGVSYGADVDLAGVAFGTDTVNGNMRFGAVFNIGSGDADGKGMGDGLKDEFDYYGFGIYSVMGFGQLAIVGDASLNVISHEVEAAGLGVKAKADTTAVTMGVTGQYTISTPSVDVVPHLGARFIRLDTDSYDLSSADGAFATTDFDVQNVFSIPLGVSFSKAIDMGGWALAPSADLSVTINTGDVEADSTTRFHGLSHNLQTSTEVLDEVTYGVAVGLGAQYGAFGSSIGINYTGSENTDSFGVNAQARYAF